MINVGQRIKLVKNGMGCFNIWISLNPLNVLKKTQMDKDGVAQAYFKRRKTIHVTCEDDGKGGCERETSNIIKMFKCYCKAEHVCFSVSAVGDLVYNYLQMGSEQTHPGWFNQFLEHFVSCLTPGNQHYRRQPTWRPYRQEDRPRWTKNEPFFILL